MDHNLRADDASAATSKIRKEREAASEALMGSPGSLELCTIHIMRPRSEIFNFYRELTNLPLFMEHLASVEVVDAQRSYWVMRLPGDQIVEWESFITEEQEGHYIAWRSDDNADVRHGGRIEFRDAPHGRGTYISLTMAWEPPAGALGKLVAAFFQRSPAIQGRRDLRRLKQLLEAGEIALSARNTQLAAEEVASLDEKE